ncbi:EAL domain-containing protein [Actinoplanes sp. N902-109]|uniref:EAL domain-containing protein n=1 Tax=Actinoplanes sp. (strain N902-109) TaxID=649831 RepID=UPI00032960C0|nr:EAL domain-containing protein [Actinoplanes sp. N902-109]AGL14314.1 response regulator receiver modulated diguanylate phosphodiesterase [Actinoplanes sp. N902-109]
MTVTSSAPTTLRDIQAIIDTQAIQPTFQPVISLEDGSVTAYEALARFDEDRFPNPVDAFAAAGEVGLGVPLELLAIEKAFEHLDALPDGTFLSANLSVEALLTPGVQAILLEHATQRIAVELTEHAQVHDYPALIAVTDRLRAAGIAIAVDDTGAGFASLSHILQLRPDIIKLDITLVRDIDQDPVRAALARSLVGFAQDIGASLIAEGIETAAEHERLRSLNVRLGQGYFLARPGPLGAR